MSNQVTIVTYNIHHALNMQGDVRLDHIANTLRSCMVRANDGSLQPSGINHPWPENYRSCVICLQELDSFSPRSSFRRQAYILARMLGMRCIYYDSMSVLGVFGFGNAILTNCSVHSTWNRRLPVKGVESRKIVYACLDLDRRMRDRGRNYNKRDRETSPTRFHVFNTHWGLKTSERIKAAEISVKLLRNIKGYAPIVFCGDLNAGLESQEGRLLTQSSGLQSVGFESELPTYPSDSPVHRIDHILTSHQIAVENVRVVRALASDHLPLVADMRLTLASER
jgi:endonuclease/exonuclease/phosphatase family metal-dependent hydrolase